MSNPIDLYTHRQPFYRTIMDRQRARPTANALGHALPKHLPTDARILDLGAGTGLTCQILHYHYPSATLIALDGSSKMLATLKQRLPHTTTITADFNTTPEVSGAPFDLIVSAGAISEYAELPHVLPWIKSLLKPNAYFINIGVDDTLLGKLTGFLWHFTPRSASTFTTACHTAGFNHIEQLTPPGHSLRHHLDYTIRAR